jgi:hypothetical protein
VTSVSAAVVTLASAVIVLGGMAALVRSIWRIALTLRDNTQATRDLSGKLSDLTTSIDGRFDRLVERVTRLENRGPP